MTNSHNPTEYGRERERVREQKRRDDMRLDLRLVRAARPANAQGHSLDCVCRTCYEARS